MSVGNDLTDLNTELCYSTQTILIYNGVHKSLSVKMEMYYCLKQRPIYSSLIQNSFYLKHGNSWKNHSNKV
jgi:hypothetical protein